MSVNGTLQQFQGLVERSLLAFVVSMPCLVFLLVNALMLWTLRSKPLFCETCRYVLLYNLLLADTVQMSLSQLLYLLGMFRLLLTYALCGVLVLLTSLTDEVSPLTLVVMSLERYVAVCFPLRHPNIASTRNTTLAVLCIWAFSFVHTLVRIGLMLQFPFHELDSLQMKENCNILVMFLVPVSEFYDQIYTGFLFVSAFLSITASYVAVMIVARSASTDKSSARKARHTLLLHLVQLGLSVLSTLHNQLHNNIYASMPRLLFVRLQLVMYVLLIILPKCLSALIYGLRDASIRRALLYHLCCGVRAVRSRTRD